MADSREPMALSPKPSTLSSQPLALNSQPSTLNPELSALSPRLSAPLVVTLGYMCVLFILSSIPGGRENGLVSTRVANMLHVPAYGLLALLWIFTLGDHGVTEHRSMCVAFLVASGYGALTELHQVWIPGRVPSAFDVTFNVVGILMFIWLYWWVIRQEQLRDRVAVIGTKKAEGKQINVRENWGIRAWRQKER